MNKLLSRRKNQTTVSKIKNTQLVPLYNYQNKKFTICSFIQISKVASLTNLYKSDGHFQIFKIITVLIILLKK